MKSKVDTVWVESRAKEIGFDLCGIAPTEDFPELQYAEEWLARGYAGEMKYLADPRRRNPEAVLPGIRSVIVCALNYNTDVPASTDPHHRTHDSAPRGWISRYAWGDDYHDVLRERLGLLVAAMHEHFGEKFDARIYADTGPLNERIFAKYAGLGWLGKNTLLLNQRFGSWMFLGAILTTLDLAPTLEDRGAPPPDLCGSCRRCIEACPTQALVEPYVLDARRCISYLTIELRETIPRELREPLGTHVFGCDICQDVCPWNRRAPESTNKKFQPRSFEPAPATASSKTATFEPDEAEPKEESAESLYLPRLEWLAGMDQREFQEVFRGSAIKRTKWRGLVRNACIALGNFEFRYGSAAHKRAKELLERLCGSEDVIIAESAFWALSRIQ